MQYTDDEIFEKLKEILHICMPEADISKVQRDTVINRDLGVDSMNFIMIMTKVEAEFGITVPDEKWSTLQTADDVIREVQKALAEKKEAEG